MHSLGVARDILKRALSEAARYNAQKIKRIEVRVRDPYFNEYDSLQFCLEVVAKDTIAHDALVTVEPTRRNDNGNTDLFHIILEVD